MTTATDKAWQLLDKEPDFVIGVTALLNTDDNAGFRNWFYDTFNEGYIVDFSSLTCGVVACAMLKQRLDYLNKITQEEVTA